MDEQRRLDDALAKMTDELLAGRTPSGQDTEEYDEVVQDLKEMIAASPTVEYQDRLTQRLHEEWRTRQQPQTRTLPSWRQRHLLLAASVAIVLVVTALLFASDGQNGGMLAGTALGGRGAEWIVLVGACLAVGLVALWRKRR